MAIHPFDAVIVVAYLLASTLLGIWIGRGNQNAGDYLLANRSLPWWAVMGSIVATETSTATFLSVPGLSFVQGGNFGFLQLALGFVAGRFLIAVFILPQYFRGRLFTAYEVLHKRFGGLTQKTASLIFLITRNLGDGLRLFLTAIVLEKVAGLDLPLCIIAIGIATIAYTFVGGIKAVVWNDCIQLVVYVVGGVVALGLITTRLPGGLTQLAEFMSSEHKLTVFDFRLDLSQTYTFWAGMIGGTMLNLGTHGTDQMMVQRYLCTKGQREAGRALVVSGFIVFAQFCLFLTLGAALACYYNAMPQPVTFERSDEVLATFIVNEMPVGLVGLTLAAVFSAAMSTLSSSLNSSAGAVVNDFLQPDRSAEQQMQSSRVWTIVFGLIQIGIGIVASKISRSVVNDALAIAGFSAGLLLGVFVLGTIAKNVGQRSAMLGLLLGAAALSYIKFGSMLGMSWGTSLAWPYYSVVGAVVTIVGGLASERVFPSRHASTAAKEISNL